METQPAKQPPSFVNKTIDIKPGLTVGAISLLQKCAQFEGEVSQFHIGLYPKGNKRFFDKNHKRQLADFIKSIFKNFRLDVTAEDSGRLDRNESGTSSLIIDSIVFYDATRALIATAEFAPDNAPPCGVTIQADTSKLLKEKVEEAVLSFAHKSRPWRLVPKSNKNALVLYEVDYTPALSIRPRHFQKTRFADIAMNYSDTPVVNGGLSTKRGLHKLITSFNPKIGKIALAHGATGTGKSWFVRSLITEFCTKSKDRNKTYVPFLVTSAAAFFSSPETFTQCTNGIKRSLFIFEDAGEILDEQMRFRGDLFPNLLNITEGSIPNAVREDLFVFTFNNLIFEVDEAIRRPGRLSAQIEFTNLTKEEARAFYDIHMDKHTEDDITRTIDKITPDKHGRYNLAKLYAALHDDEQIIVTGAAEKTLGFK